MIEDPFWSNCDPTTTTAGVSELTVRHEFPGPTTADNTPGCAPEVIYIENETSRTRYRSIPEKLARFRDFMLN